MKPWMLFVLCTVLCWGAYIPTLHHAQASLGRNSSLRAFMFVGMAYFLMAILIPGIMLAAKVEPVSFTRSGTLLGLGAGVLGSMGALGIIFALRFGGKPSSVAPLVFAGAPVMATFVAMMWDKPSKAPSPLFYVGIGLAAVGAAMILRFKPV